MAGVKIFTIDGNIGSGKSTLLANLQKIYTDEPNIVFAPEPVDEWAAIKDSSGNTMLEKFYQDQKEWSFSFQMMAYISRLNILRTIAKENPGSIIITERSLYTDRFVFAKMLFDTGLIADVNYQIYLKWFDVFIEEYPINGCIYVKTDPQICFDRIKKRSRAGESSIPLDYLISCDEYHKNMLKEMRANFGFSALTLNGNEDIYSNPELIDEWANKINNYIQHS